MSWIARSGMLCISAASAAAQGGHFDAANPRVIPWQFGTQEPVTHAISGFLTENHRRDAVLLQGTTPVLVHSPGTYESMLTYDDRSANDIALLRAPGWERDGFALVGPGGLAFVTYDNGVFSTQDIPVSGFEGALSLEVADFDGDGTPGVAAVRSDGLWLHVVADASAGSTTVSGFPLSAPPLAMLAADFDDEGGVELAIAQPDGLRILNRKGDVLHYFPSPPLVAVSLAAFRQDGYARDRIAAVVTVQGYAEQLLAVVGGGDEPLLDLGAVDVFATAAGHVDSDEDQDLITLSRTVDDAVVFLNKSDGNAPSSVQTFGLDELETVGTQGVFGPGNVAQPLCADFDADGDDDLLVFDPGPPELLLFSNKLNDPATQRIGLDEGYLGYFVLWNGTLQAELELAWTLPLEPLAGATDIEFTVWIQPDGSELMGAEALAVETFALDVEGEVPQVSAISIPGASLDLDDTYILEARLVQRNGQTLVSAGPTWTGAFRPSAFYSELLDGQPAQIQRIAVYVVPLTIQLEIGTHGPHEDPNFALLRREDSGLIPLPDPPDHDEDPPFGT